MQCIIGVANSQHNYCGANSRQVWEERFSDSLTEDLWLDQPASRGERGKQENTDPTFDKHVFIQTAERLDILTRFGRIFSTCFHKHKISNQGLQGLQGCFIFIQWWQLLKCFAALYQFQLHLRFIFNQIHNSVLPQTQWVLFEVITKLTYTAWTQYY